MREERHEQEIRENRVGFAQDSVNRWVSRAELSRAFHSSPATNDKTLSAASTPPGELLATKSTTSGIYQQLCIDAIGCAVASAAIAHSAQLQTHDGLLNASRSSRGHLDFELMVKSSRQEIFDAGFLEGIHEAAMQVAAFADSA